MKSFTVEEEEKERKDGTEECSPGGVLEDCSVSTESKTSSCISNRYESETTSPRASTSGSEGQPNATTAPCPWRDFFRVFRKGPAPSFHTLPPLKEGVPKQSKGRSRSRKFREAIVPTLNSPLDGEFCHFKSSWKNFSLSELQAATDTFSKEKLIGEGGYAEVYKGQLEDGQFVAIKRLTRGSPEEMTVDFLSELGIIVHADYPNIAKVIGYGIEGGMHLVVELSANGSLASLLYEPITVRQALDSSQQSLVMWAKPFLMKNSIKDLVDPTRGDAYDSEQMDHVACAACICIDQSPSEKPQMSQVVRVLEGDESSLIELKLRQRSRHQRTPTVADLFDADEYNPTEYLSHLNQQMVVLVNCNEKSEDHDRSTTDRNQQKGGGGSRPHRN